MIHNSTKFLRGTVLGAGLLAMGLRGLLYATAIDQKGLLTENHWTTWSILILTGLVLALLLLTTRKIQRSDAADSTPASYIQGAGSLLLAGTILQQTLSLYAVAADRLNLVTVISGFAAALALLVVGICRMAAKKPSFLCHSALSIYFAFHMVSFYRLWSANPQLMDYCFYLLAFLCLMLTAYFLAGFEGGMAHRRGLVFFSMAATFFCCLALPESGDGPTLIACGFWAFTCAPKMTPKNEEREHDQS